MKPSRVFWGVLFLSIGLLLLLDRLTTIPIHIVISWKFWPLLLVLWGIGALVEQRAVRDAIATFCAIFLALLLMSVVIGDEREERGGEFVGAPEQTLSVPLGEGVERALFTLESGAGSFRLGDTTSDLVAARTWTSLGEYDLEESRSDGEVDAVLRLVGGHRGWRWGHGHNSVSVQLHRGPAWEMRFNVGAARLDIDATPFNVEVLDIRAGASTVGVKLGDRAAESRVIVRTGVSSVAIEVPESSGCEVEVESAVASRDFRGFEKIDRGHYRTSNYDSATSRISLRFEAGVSSLKVTRY